MAKKLTRQALETMVMSVMKEAYVQKPTMDVGAAATTPFGRKPTLPKSGDSEGEAIQFLRMLAEDPKVPDSIKDQISDFLSYEPSTPEMTTDTEWDLETIPTANIQAITDETPTAKMSKADQAAAQKRTAASVYSSPQGITSPQGGRPAAPALSMGAPKKKSFFSRFFKEEKELESLVMEALEEMGMQSYLGSAGDRTRTPFTSKNRSPKYGDSNRSTAVLPTAKEKPTAKLAADEKPTTKSLSSRKPSEEYMKRVKGKYADASAEEGMLESLVASVLAEMSKKKPVKDTKKPVKK